MNSSGYRAVTVVTIVTLLYALFFKHHHWLWKLTGRQTHTTTVVCVRDKPCPKTRTVVKKVYGQPTREELQKARADGAGAPANRSRRRLALRWTPGRTSACRR